MQKQLSPKLIWCKLRQSINNFNQSFNIITRIIKTKYQSHTNTRIYVKKPLLLKGKKPQEILQIRFTMVKSIIKFQIYQPYVCLTAKEKFRIFFSLSHTLFFFLTALTTKPHSFFTAMHIASSLSLLLYFATLIKVSQILIDLCILQNLLSTTPKFCCLFLALPPKQKSHFNE